MPDLGKVWGAFARGGGAEMCGRRDEVDGELGRAKIGDEVARSCFNDCETVTRTYARLFILRRGTKKNQKSNFRVFGKCNLECLARRCLSVG